MKRLNGLNSKLTAASLLSLALSACGGKEASYSVMSSTQTFKQEVSTQNNKVDIIWVVDGSGTMANHQNNLAANFGSFIQAFAAKGFDANMVVASTDAWVREYGYNPASSGCTANPNDGAGNNLYKSSVDCYNTLAKMKELSWFRDGDIYGNVGASSTLRSGKFLINTKSPLAQVTSTFQTNVKTGVRGDGAMESGLGSLRATLRLNEDGTPGYGTETHTALSTFRRSDAFLSVIFVTDEEDQSVKKDGTPYANNAAYVTAFKKLLDTYTGSTVGNRRYNVSGIILSDIQSCYALNPQATISTRYVDIANATNGVVGNICASNFASQLSIISQKIATLSSRFKLNQAPVEDTIQIIVNGAAVPKSATNGWSLILTEGSHYIQFNGDAIPPQGASIAVNFDPASI